MSMNPSLYSLSSRTMRPAYPTPQPSYAQYAVHPSSPGSDSSYGVVYYDYEGFSQTPTPMRSHRQSPQHDYDLAASAANLALQSPVIQSPLIQSPGDLARHSPVNQLHGYGLFTPSNMLDSAQPISPPEDDYDDTVVSVSTAFHPTAHPELPPADTIFSASDAVLFYVHSTTILLACPTAFQACLGSSLLDPKFRDVFTPLEIPSAELNIMLHMLYGTSSALHSPTFECLVNAVEGMPSASIQPDMHILPGTPLFTLLLSHAPLHPFDLYALAAQHRIHPLAVAASPYLLSHPLQSITDVQADRLGAVYLKKLLLLHAERFAALRTILLKPPHPHPPTRECGFAEQKGLTRAWALASAYLAWDARPDIPTQTIQTALDPLLTEIACPDCTRCLRARIREVVVHWTSVGGFALAAGGVPTWAPPAACQSGKQHKEGCARGRHLSANEHAYAVFPMTAVAFPRVFA